MADQTDAKDKSAATKAEPSEAESASSKDSKTVTLALQASPFFLQAFRVPTEDGGMLSFDEHGTEVPSEDADKYIEAAALAGVALNRKA